MADSTREAALDFIRNIDPWVASSKTDPVVNILLAWGQRKRDEMLAEFACALGVEQDRPCDCGQDPCPPIPLTLDEIVDAAKRKINEAFGRALGIHDRFEWRYSLTPDEIVDAGLKRFRQRMLATTEMGWDGGDAMRDLPLREKPQSGSGSSGS